MPRCAPSIAGFPACEVAVNPTTGLQLPAAKGGRDRIAPPAECAELLEALKLDDRALWATAMYGGLRRGELMALRVEDVDLGAGVIHVRRGWDYARGGDRHQVRQGSPRANRVALRDYLDEHLLGLDGARALCSAPRPRNRSRPRRPPNARRKRGTARTSDAEAETAQGVVKLLAPITLHECRHTFASLMIAAGVNAKALSTYMGHAKSGSPSTATGT